MIEWLRAAHEDPGRFTSAFPGVAAHIALWSAVAGPAMPWRAGAGREAAVA
jgi:hypothetical protein